MAGSMAVRALGVVILAITIGLASCQALFVGPPETAETALPTPGEEG